MLDGSLIIGLDVAGQQKIGRNDPCPCGSGAKYKRCACGTYEAQQFPTAKAAAARQAAERAKLAAMTPEERAARLAQARRNIAVVLGFASAVIR